MTKMVANLCCEMADFLSGLDPEGMPSVGKIEFSADGTWWRVEKGKPAHYRCIYINPNMPAAQIDRLVQIKLGKVPC